MSTEHDKGPSTRIVPFVRPSNDGGQTTTPSDGPAGSRAGRARSLLMAAYGKGNTRDLLRRAFWAEHPGADAKLARLEYLSLRLADPRGSNDLAPEARRAMQAEHDALVREVEAGRDAILARYKARANASGASDSPAPQGSSASLPAKPVTSGTDVSIHAQAGDARQADRLLSNMASIHAPEAGATAGKNTLRTTDLSSSPMVRDGKIDQLPPAFAVNAGASRWTPAMDRLLGTDTDAALAKKWKMNAETVRRRRTQLGIEATKRLARWTPERDAIVLANADDAVAGELLGLSPMAVKVRRSRLKAKAPLHPTLPGRFGQMTRAELDAESDRYDAPDVAEQDRLA